jgi:hypothetical protein
MKRRIRKVVAAIMAIIVILAFCFSGVAMTVKAASVPEKIGPLAAIDTAQWTAIGPITFPKDKLKNVGGWNYVEAEWALRQMGYSPATKDGRIEWNDELVGKYWIDGEYIYGPEILVRLMGSYVENGKLWVPARQLAEAMFWTINAVPEGVIVERLVPKSVTVDKTMQVASVFGEDASGTIKLMRVFLVSTGASFGSTPSRDYNPRALPLDTQNKYYFPTAKVWIKWCAQLKGDVCLHTTYTTTKSELNTYGMQHGYEVLGERASNGCVRTLFSDARLVWSFAGALSITVVDGQITDEAKATKARLLNAQPETAKYIAHMKLYE